MLTCTFREDYLPVMVWFYGGAFQLGTAAMYPGQELAVERQVVVVTVNYRFTTLHSYF